MELFCAFTVQPETSRQISTELPTFFSARFDQGTFPTETPGFAVEAICNADWCCCGSPQVCIIPSLRDYLALSHLPTSQLFLKVSRGPPKLNRIVLRRLHPCVWVHLGLHVLLYSQMPPHGARPGHWFQGGALTRRQKYISGARIINNEDTRRACLTRVWDEWFPIGCPTAPFATAF